jgi:O-antigen/teichoic acid export membrane protein
MTAAPANPALSATPPLAPPEHGAPALAGRAARGSAWTTGHYVLSQALRVLSNVVLARLLAPEAFGLMALLSVFVQGLQMFTELGIGTSIIQHKRGDDRRFLDTAWTLQTLRGGVILAGCVLLAWPVARAYHEPAIVWMLPAVGLTSLISGFNSTALYTLNRRLELGKIMALDMGYQFTIFAVAALWALRWPSAWALIAGIVAASLVRLALSHALTPGHRDRFGWDRDAFRSMLHFGVWIFVGTVFAFLAGQADRLMLPRMHSMQELGLYGIACTLALAPFELVGRLANATVFPAIAEKGRHDARAMREAASRARRLLLIAGLAGTVCVVLIAPLFIRALYPALYRDAGWIAQLVALATWIALLQASIDRTLLAAGSPKDLAWAAGARLVATVPACILLDRWLGLPGFVLGVAVGALASHAVVTLALARHGLALTMQDIRYTLACAAICALGVLPVRLLGPHASDGLALGVQSALAAVLCSGVGLWAFRSVRRTWLDVRPGGAVSPEARP